VIGWTTFGSALAPVVLLVAGLLLAGSSSDLSDAIAADPIGALATVLPTWYLVPFVVVAVLGLVGGAVLDIYSSGLALLAAGLRMPVGHRRRGGSIRTTGRGPARMGRGRAAPGFPRSTRPVHQGRTRREERVELARAR
jgi:hypothetical protein